jgi:hypothetical protein
MFFETGLHLFKASNAFLLGKPPDCRALGVGVILHGKKLRDFLTGSDKLDSFHRLPLKKGINRYGDLISWSTASMTLRSVITGGEYPFSGRHQLLPQDVLSFHLNLFLLEAFQIKPVNENERSASE